MVQGGMTCIKYLMFVFNFVFVVCGIALIIVGALVQGKDYTYFLNSKYFTAPVILIVVGCVIFVLAFLGCFGAVKENHCMVMTFGILLFLVFIIEIAGGIAAYVHRNELEDILKKGMTDSIKQKKTDAMKIWDDIQSNWHCCGVNNSTDWTEAGMPIPKSCCEDQSVECTTKAYEKGCFKTAEERMKSSIGAVGGAAIGIAVIELIGVAFSCCLASAIKKEYEGV